MILERSFYERDSLLVAEELLGKVVVHETPEGIVAGKIVETEAYKGPEDKASHAYGNLRTSRTETQFGPKGHSYIYLIYGLYYCFNVTAGKVPGKPEAVLIRALEPVVGTELMMKRRPKARGNLIDLANGPSKLSMALGLSKKQNGADMLSKLFYINDNEPVSENEIVRTTRIGVDYSEEWKNKPWRFYIKDNPCVSVKVR